MDVADPRGSPGQPPVVFEYDVSRAGDLNKRPSETSLTNPQIKSMSDFITSLSHAHIATIRQAAARCTRALAPLPTFIRGAARQAVISALLTNGYATKCYFPTHVEYLLTEISAASCTCIEADFRAPSSSGGIDSAT